MVDRSPLVGTVPDSLRVTRAQLIQWASGLGSVGELPRLVRRLIAETVPSVEWLDMPSGEGVGSSGWDGVVECRAGNQFVPAGRSVWELSTEQKNANSKAHKDYDKRMRATPESVRAELSYVAVGCAPWTKSREFVDDKSRGNDFGMVRAMNVASIEAWLECAPVTTVWMREQIGAPVEGIETLSGWWARWLESTRIPLDAGVVLAGRTKNAEMLRDFCQQDSGGVVTIGGHWHRDEILAFVAAALSSDPPGPSNGDALYVEDKATVQRLLATGGVEASSRASPEATGITVVVPSAEFERYYKPGSGHRMIIPTPGSSRPNIVLEPVDSGTVATWLEGAGEHTSTAQELGGLARMSLLTLRRRLARNPALFRPAWAAGSIGRRLRRCLLLNSWKEDNNSDRHLVEGFVGCSYEDAVEMLHAVAQENEPPMVLTGKRWHVVAPADAWHQIAEQITQQDLDLFGCIAGELLSEPDPLSGATDAEHLRMLLGEVAPRCSDTVRRGLATTLALLGSFPHKNRGDVTPGANRATPIVNRILMSANEEAEPNRWASVVEVLDLLAEADPDTVLGGLRTCLSGRHAAMFADRQSSRLWLSQVAPQQRMLKGLRVLAWSADHLIGTVDILARLATVDDQGVLSEKALRDLSWTMSTWSPQTSASGEARLEALDMLRQRHSTVAWHLMCLLLSPESDSVPNRPGPLYRGWKRAASPVTNREWLHMVTEIGDWLIADAGSNPERLKTVIGQVSSVPPSAREALHSTLKCVADSDPSEESRSVIWSALREMVTSHRTFSDTSWALPERELRKFAQVMELLRPSAPLDAHGWLFDSGIVSIDGTHIRNYEAFVEVLEARQAEAVAATLDLGGVAAVLELAVGVNKPQSVGIALANTGSDVDLRMLVAMDTAPEAVTQAALGYFAIRFRELDWEDIDRFVEQHSPSEQVTADLLRAIPPIKQPWRRAHELGAEVADEYWARVKYGDLGPPSGSFDKLLEVSQRLRDAQRVDFAAWYLWLGASDFGAAPRFAEETATCLEQLAKREGALDPRRNAGLHHLSPLMKALDNHRNHVGVDRVAMIEWQYYPILKHERDFDAPNLYRKMAQEPDFFASLLELAFRPATRQPEPEPEPTHTDQQAALSAYGLLNAWPSPQIVPGLDSNGVINEEQLNSWVDHVRQRAAEEDRTKIGDQRIGAALAASPPDPDKEWPSLAVRDLIERLNSDDVDLGITMAIFNKRQGTTRSPTDGGDQERDLADTYHEKSLRFSDSPRTSAIFKDLANTYQRDATWHDHSAETHRRGLSP